MTSKMRGKIFDGGEDDERRLGLIHIKYEVLKLQAGVIWKGRVIKAPASDRRNPMCRRASITRYARASHIALSGFRPNLSAFDEGRIV